MKGSLIFLSLVLGGMGLFCNAYFYGSFGSVNDFSGSYALIGLAFDLAKFALVPVGVYFFARAQILEASLAGGAWLVLTIISLVAAFGFLSLKNSEYEAAALAQSTAFESAKAQVESANAKVEALSKYANSQASDAALQTKAELEAQLNILWSAPAKNSLGHKIGMSVQAKLGNCPGSSWYHKTYCPKITALEQQIAQAQSKVGGYDQYLAALAFRDNALKQLSELNVDSTSSYHPVFENIAVLLGIHPNNAKVAFITTSAFVLELLASLLIFLRSRLSFQNPTGRTFDGEYANGVPHNDAASMPKPATQNNEIHAQGDETHAQGRPRSDAASTPKSAAQGDETYAQGGARNDADSTPKPAQDKGGKEQTLYARLASGVQDTEITNLSFKNIRQFLQVTDNSLIGKLRDQLVFNGLAVYDATRKCIPTKSLNA